MQLATGKGKTLSPALASSGKRGHALRALVCWLHICEARKAYTVCKKHIEATSAFRT